MRNCNIWVQGSLGMEYIRRSLDVTSWQAAQDLVRGWEASGEVGVTQAETPEIPDAVERYFDDIKARELSQATVGKQTVLLTSRSGWRTACASIGEKRMSDGPTPKNSSRRPRRRQRKPRSYLPPIVCERCGGPLVQGQHIAPLFSAKLVGWVSSALEAARDSRNHRDRRVGQPGRSVPRGPGETKSFYGGREGTC